MTPINLLQASERTLPGAGTSNPEIFVLTVFLLQYLYLVLGSRFIFRQVGLECRLMDEYKTLVEYECDWETTGEKMLVKQSMGDNVQKETLTGIRCCTVRG